MNQQSTKPIPLPVRIAHPSQPQIAHFTNEYFELLVGCGYSAIAVDASPFDIETGRVSQFFKGWHLISLYDIAYSAERHRYRDYFHELGRRAEPYGIRIYFQTYEPRLPYYAWGSTPPQWRGHGGWVHDGNDAISFCWSEPDAVAYWKQMARDALAAVPEVAGLSVSFMDNEAIPCDERCPKCRGEKAGDMMRDVLATYGEIGRSRPDFNIGIIDWWMKEEQIATMREVLGDGSFVVGHSCHGLTQSIDGEAVPGSVGDMTMVSAGCGDSFLAKQKQFTALGFRFIDRTTWSHACENWNLPAPPDPGYAIEKLNALRRSGAEGWRDYDCGALEPGSIAEAITAWTRRPEASTEELVAEVLQRIYGEAWRAALPAYLLYARGKTYFPVAYESPELNGFSSRSMALGMAIAGPFFLEDFVYFDTLHAYNFFAPYNLVTPDTIRYATPRVARAAESIGEAFALVQKVASDTSAAFREREAFEIHYRSYRATTNYLRLAQAKLAWLNKESDDSLFEIRVRDIAADELENLAGIELWLSRNPGKLTNPILHLPGILEEAWPGIEFQTNLLRPKRRSLERLRHYKVGPPLPLSQRL